MEAASGKRQGKKNIVIFGLGGEQFGVDVKDVREVLLIREISPLPKTPAFIEGVINLRGHVIGIVDLRTLFELKNRAITADTRIMIVRIKNTLVGFIVDGVFEVASIPEEAIEQAPAVVNLQAKNNFISAVGKYDDKMIFILNLDLILDEEGLKELREIRTKT